MALSVADLKVGESVRARSTLTSTQLAKMEFGKTLKIPALKINVGTLLKVRRTSLTSPGWVDLQYQDQWKVLDVRFSNSELLTYFDAKRPAKSMNISDSGINFILGLETLKNVSNRLHWPKGASGVTIGPGYDMKERSATEIKSDLVAVGVSSTAATSAAAGSGLIGKDASKFALENKNLIDLSSTQELQLLKRIAPSKEYYVKKWISAALYQFEYDALVSFCYNPGGSFVPVSNEINAGRMPAAVLIIKDRTFSGGESLPGLVDRRVKETSLLQTGNYT